MIEKPWGAEHAAHRNDDGSWTLVLAYPINPLPANGQRGHWRAHARIVREVRSVSAWLAAKAVPWESRPLPRIRVHLTQIATTNRRRDADNLVPLMKALTDGLTSAGVIEDDHDGIVARDMPSIVVMPQGTAHFELTITREDHP